MLTEAVRLGGARATVTLDVRFAGTFYLCQALRVQGAHGGDPCDPDSVKEFMRFWSESWHRLEGGGAEDVVGYSNLFRQAVAQLPGALDADVFACMLQAVWCWMLRRRAEEPVTAPMLVGLGMALMQDVPRGWRDELAADLALWAREGQRAPEGGRRDVIWTCHHTWSSSCSGSSGWRSPGSTHQAWRTGTAQATPRPARAWCRWSCCAARSGACRPARCSAGSC
ncbi:unnamed protein product [Prorocentrum cordatum]|uniref:Uncharacterized protein n=1 Tax=Prorocentrum cordatum TaxID=2364126 RepID=A0ABN9PJ93_9DINO|nr:unnamed protein product [Polarella glacialis]